MLNVNIKIDDKLTPLLKKQQAELKKFPKEAHAEFVDLTPVRSGNARSKTRLKQNEIVADYPYAERLDNGWSRQAPRGMTQPFEAWVRRWVNRVFGGK